MGAAQRRASRKFGKLYVDMAKQRASADTALAGAVKSINDGIAKQAALADSRFSKTVKNIAAARAQAAKQVSDARKVFATGIARTVAAVKDQESRLSGEIAVVSGEVARNKAIQLRVNRRTNAELARITKLSNERHSASIRARGKLRALLDENKRAAAEEVRALNKLFNNKLSKICRRAAKARKVEAGFEVLTGVIRAHRTAGALDRKLIRQQTKAMGQDMQKAIARAIQ